MGLNAKARRKEILNLKCGNGGKNEKNFADEFIHGFLV